MDATQIIFSAGEFWEGVFGKSKGRKRTTFATFRAFPAKMKSKGRDRIG